MQHLNIPLGMKSMKRQWFDDQGSMCVVFRHSAVVESSLVDEAELEIWTSVVSLHPQMMLNYTRALNSLLPPLPPQKMKKMSDKVT